MTEGNTLLQFFDTFGSLGVMGALVWMFMKGQLLPRPIVDEMLEAERKGADKVLETERENTQYIKDEVLAKFTELEQNNE